jgi:hypothetical protein
VHNNVFIKLWPNVKHSTIKSRQELRTREDVFTEYLESQQEKEDDDDDDLYDDVDEYLDALERNDTYEDSLEEDEDDDEANNNTNLRRHYIDFREAHTPFVKKMIRAGIEAVRNTKSATAKAEAGHRIPVTGGQIPVLPATGIWQLFCFIYFENHTCPVNIYTRIETNSH